MTIFVAQLLGHAPADDARKKTSRTGGEVRRLRAGGHVRISAAWVFGSGGRVVVALHQVVRCQRLRVAADHPTS